MTDRQENTLSMYEEVYLFYNDNLTAMNASAPGFANTMIVFKGFIDDIRRYDQLINTPTKGITLTKDEYKKQACKEADRLCKGLRFYAESILSLDLKEKYNYSLSELLAARDEALPQILLNIYDEIAFLITQTPNPLLGSKITPDRKDAFLDLINNYKSSVPSTRNATVNKKTNNQQLKNLFNQANDVLKNQLDNLAAQILDERVAIGYKNARIIVDSGTRHTKIRGIVTQADTGLPVQQARVRAVSSKGTVAEAFTDEDGSYSIKTPKFKEIPYSVSAKKGEMETQVSEVYVKLGKPTNLDIVLEPIQT